MDEPASSNTALTMDTTTSTPVQTHHDKQTFQGDKDTTVWGVSEELEECDRLNNLGYKEYGYGLHAKNQAEKELGGEVESYSVRLIRDVPDVSTVTRLQVFYILKKRNPSDGENTLSPEESTEG